MFGFKKRRLTKQKLEQEKLAKEKARKLRLAQNKKQKALNKAKKAKEDQINSDKEYKDEQERRTKYYENLEKSNLKDLSKMARKEVLDKPTKLWSNKSLVISKRNGVNKIPNDLLEVYKNFGLSENDPLPVGDTNDWAPQNSFIVPIDMNNFLKVKGLEWLKNGSNWFDDDADMNKHLNKLKKDTKDLTLFYFIDDAAFLAYDKRNILFELDLDEKDYNVKKPGSEPLLKYLKDNLISNIRSAKDEWY